VQRQVLGEEGQRSKSGDELTRGCLCEEVRLALDKHTVVCHQIWSGQSASSRHIPETYCRTPW